MRILLVYHELGGRGGERLFTTLAKGSINNDHEVSLVVGRYNKEFLPVPKEVKIIKPPQLLNNLIQNNWIFAFLSMPITFINIIRTIPKVDVIYSGESFTGLWPAICASLLSKKALVLSVFELGKRTSSPTGWRGVLNFLWDKTNTYLVKKVKFAVTINSTLIPSLKKNFGIPNVYSVPAGIDFSHFANPNPTQVIKKYRLNGKKIILMQGLLHPQKRQDLAIESFNLTKKKIPNCTLIISGGGDQNYLNKLKKLAYKLKLEKDVVFTGFVPDDELKNYYRAADVVLMCGPIAGLTVIEALYSDKLTIYPTSGKPPLGPVEEYGLGIILMEKSAEEFSKSIIDVLTNPENYKSKLKKDKEIALSKFSMHSFTESTLKVLKSANRRV